MSMTILDMPEWKSKIFQAVAWILGYRNEYAYVILLNIDLKNMSEQQAKDLIK